MTVTYVKDSVIGPLANGAISMTDDQDARPHPHWFAIVTDDRGVSHVVWGFHTLETAQQALRMVLLAVG